MLDARGHYFDVRTGNTWDLFFPGYYRSVERRALEQECGARLIGPGYKGDQVAMSAPEDEQLIEPGYEGGQLVRAGPEGEQPIGRRYLGDWYFKEEEFDQLRRFIGQSSERRWAYSGGTDLVLVGGWLPTDGEPTIDWASTISGQLTDQSSGIRTLTLANVIENISRDLETEAEDASYGVSEVTDEPPPPRDQTLREFMINALASIAAALAVHKLGS